MAEVAGVEDELLLVGAAVDAAHRRPHADSREALDDAEQLEWPERLQQQRVRAGGAGHVLHVFHPGEQDDADPARRPRSAFSSRQNASPSMPGMPTSSTITSGRERRNARLGLGRARGLVDLDLDVLEGRPQELAEPGIVIDQQQAHFVSPGSKSLVDKGIGRWDQTLSRDLPRSGDAAPA